MDRRSRWTVLPSSQFGLPLWPLVEHVQQFAPVRRLRDETDRVPTDLRFRVREGSEQVLGRPGPAVSRFELVDQALVGEWIECAVDRRPPYVEPIG
jgi:hypothetical protein